METEVLYVKVPRDLKRALEDLATTRQRQGAAADTLTALVIQACDDLLVREVPNYESVLDGLRAGGKIRSTGTRDLTHPEQIVCALAHLVQAEDEEFSRNDVRQHLGLDRKPWAASYSPTFQAMRSDHPGGAPPIGAAFENLIQRTAHGRYKLTEKGWSVTRRLDRCS
jgi:hypothetical protein